MAKFLYKHRRGTTSDWANKGDEIIPFEGEIVIELDEVNNLHKLKIGDGVHAYSALKYLQAGDEIVTQVLAKTTPRIVTVNLTTNWTMVADNEYSQVIDLDNITEHSRLDLQPSADMFAEFKQLGLLFITENNNGIITVYSVGNMPTKAYTMQATIVETECDGLEDPIVGNPAGTPVIQADWTQTDETKSDFIKNKPAVTNTELGYLSGMNAPVKTRFIRKLTAEDNMDEITEPGVYWWGNGTSAPTGQESDLPFTNASVLEVIPIMNPGGTQYGVTQRLWRYGASGFVAQRTMYGNNYSSKTEWAKFYTTVQPPSVGDLGITATVDELNNIGNVTEQVDTLSERVDNLIALPDGSTTNDARLEDICVGSGSTQYSSPGDAVRAKAELTDMIILNANVIIGNNGDLYVEKSSNTYYIKAVKTDSTTTTTTIGIYSNKTPERLFNWADVLTTLSTYATASPNGVADCLRVPAGYAFVYDVKNDTVSMRYVYNLPTGQYITLFMNNYGFIGGKLNEGRSRKNRDDIEALQDDMESVKPSVETNTGIGTPVLIGVDGQLYIEKASGGTFYIQTRTSASSTATENIVLYCKQTGGYSGKFSWDDVCATFPSRIKTSPNGVENCLYMGDHYVLVYNTKSEVLEVVEIINVDIQHHVILFGAYYGAIFGRLLDFNNRWARRDIDALSAKVVNLEKSVGAGIPDYYMAEITDTKNKLSVLPADNFNYLVISDIHNSHSDFTPDKLKALMGSIVNIANSSNIDAVICLGDLIEGGASVAKATAKTEIMEITELLGDCRKPVLFAYGNHDQNAYNWSGSDTTDHYILPNEWVNMCVRPFVNKNDYYAIDFEDKGIRLIVTNTCDYNEQVDSEGNVTISSYSAIMMRQEQLDDICDMLDNTSHDIVVCGHALPTNLLDLLKAFNTKGTYTKSNGTAVNFSDKMNRILLYNFGHHHNEAFEYVSAYDLNMFAANCGSLASVQQNCWIKNDILTTWTITDETGTGRVAGTITEACYYVVSIGDGKINKINFGAGEDGILAL